ncbi:MAG: glycosyltransferase family 4 protein [Dehalococcoidales bacterium]|nr:glycosyltransferase family 4 protein [Dehalococcoidales bacterium]
MGQKRLEGRKILYFAPCRWDAGVGGGGRLRNMLDVLAKLGADVRLISYWTEEKSSLKHTQVNPHLKATTVAVRKSAPKFFKLFSLGSVFWEGLRQVRGNSIIMAHAPSIISGFPALVMAGLFRKPLVIDLTDVKDPDTPLFIYNRVLRKASVVLSVSRLLTQKAIEVGCRNVTAIPIIIDCDVFKPDPSARIETRAKLGINESDIVIGYAGSFWSIEGLPFLLSAFAGLHAKYDNIKFVLVGGKNVPGSDDIPALARELNITDRVILVPQQPHDMMPKYLAAFDIACSPKIDCPENRAASPIKIHEYMAMGLPVVISQIGEVAEIIENGVDGFLVRPGDEAELAAVLERMVQDPDAGRKIGAKAREKILRNYTLGAALGAVEEALKPALR